MKQDMIQYRFLSGDINYQKYGGKWYKRVDSQCGGYYVIEAVNMDDATGDITQGKYMFNVLSLWLDSTPQEHIRSALQCCGLENEKEITELIKIEALTGYGYFDLEESILTNSFDRTLRRLKQKY